MVLAKVRIDFNRYVVDIIFCDYIFITSTAVVIYSILSYLLVSYDFQALFTWRKIARLTEISRLGGCPFSIQF